MTRTQRLLKLPILLVAFALILTACGSRASASDGAATSASAVPTTTIASAVTDGSTGIGGKRKLEIFHEWIGQGQEESINALVDVYRRRNPGVEVVNDFDPRLGEAHHFMVLQTLFQRGKPPDSWQLHAGKETLTFVIPGQMEPLTRFFKDQGFDKVMPRLLLEQITIKGEIYTVPLNIHRSNVLWYNPKVFTANNLTPPRTLTEFFKVAEALRAKGITPLAVGGANQFEVAHLFESVLLATYGPEDYLKLFDKDGTMWADPRTVTAIDTLKEMLGYANAGRGALSWVDAAQRVLDGKAGMTIMGDWTEGYYKSQGAQPNVDFGWAAAPGTDGAFMWLSDSFGLAKGAPHRAEAIAWLKTVGSKEGQDAFNPLKGSIPARTDPDKSLYDEYLQWSIDQFRSDTLAPSIVHGSAAPDAFSTSYLNALDAFSNDLDVKALTQALIDAAVQLGQ